MLFNYNRLTNNIICQLSHWKNRKEFNRIRTEKGDYSLEGFDRLKCIYIHIPKAAGISINKAIYGNYGGAHRTAHIYKRIFGPAVYKRYFKFTFVRNPHSRLLSAYRFLRGGGFDESEFIWARENLSDYVTFDEFVRKWINEESIWSYNHFKPQYSFVCDVDLNPEVDFIGKVESIDEDFNEVCKILNIKNKLSVHNSSKTDNSNWEQHYSKYSLDKVHKIYHLDFQIFNY